MWKGFNWLSIGPMMGCYKHGDELLIPWKAGYFVAT
jgi:hypothetical protein